MLGRSTLGPAVVTFALGLAPVLAGCDSEADRLPITAEVFEEGVAKDSEGGAFRVVLSTPEVEIGEAEGLGVGDNTLIVRLGFHDPADPLAPGRGIPAANVTLDAWMPLGEGSVEGLRGVYAGDGRYEITGFTLPEAGVWQLDFALSIGEAVDDSVSFAFLIPDRSDRGAD